MFKQRKYKHFASAITSVSLIFEDIYNVAPPDFKALIDSMTGEELEKYISLNHRCWSKIISDELLQRLMPALKEAVSRALCECPYNNPQIVPQHSIH